MSITHDGCPTADCDIEQVGWEQWYCNTHKGYVSLGGLDPYIRIKELEAKLEENNRLTKRWDKYLGKAWHHDFCPLYSGSTHGGCTCGYSDVMEGE